MSQDSAPGLLSRVGLSGLSLRRKIEPSAVSHDRSTPTSRPSERPEKETEERRGDVASSEEAKRLRKEVEHLNRLLDRQAADVENLRREEETLKGKCKRRDDWIAGLEQEIGRMRDSYHGVVEGHLRRIQGLEERLKETEELLATRSAELSGAQTFLSTTDRLSEVEVLSIVRDLNENIFQVAVNLTEEWEKLDPPQATGQMDVDPTSGDPTSGPRVPALIRLVRNRDPTGLTFLLQSHLCSWAAEMTSTWGRYKELAVLVSVYKRLSASEGQAISAKWRSLTHSYLSPPSPDSASLVEELANILGNTGSFSSTQQSLELIRAVALEGIDTIIRLCLRLELAFMVEVISSNMYLLVEAPDTVFDDARMTNEFESDGVSTPGGQDRVAGMTEVGVGKSVCGGPGEGRRVEVLLKTKVVLEKDVVGSRKIESDGSDGPGGSGGNGDGGGGGGGSDDNGGGEEALRQNETDAHDTTKPLVDGKVE